MLQLGKDKNFKEDFIRKRGSRVSVITLACTAAVRGRGGGVASERGVEADGARGA